VSDLFIVDNGDKNWKAKNYLHEWAELAHAFDVATGYFEVGALLALDGSLATLTFAEWPFLLSVVLVARSGLVRERIYSGVSSLASRGYSLIQRSDLRNSVLASRCWSS